MTVLVETGDKARKNSTNTEVSNDGHRIHTFMIRAESLLSRKDKNSQGSR